MIVSQMHLEFKMGVDKADSLNSPNFLPEEIDLYLSEAQEQFIEQRTYGSNMQDLGLEESQKRVTDIQSLITSSNITPQATTSLNKPNGKYAELPPDCRHVINEEVTTTSTDCNGVITTKRLQVTPITHDRYNKIIDNPFSRPDKTKVYRLAAGRSTVERYELISSSDTTIVTYHIRYIKNPRKIDLKQIRVPLGLGAAAEGDLHDSAYREVIRMAVRNALGDIESPRVNEGLQKLKEIE